MWGTNNRLERKTLTKESKFRHHAMRVEKGLSLGEEYNPGQIIKLALQTSIIKTVTGSGDVSWTTLDIDDMLPSGVDRPQNAIAAILDVEVNDSGSSGAETYLALATPGIIYSAKTQYCRPAGVNDQEQNRLVILQITGDGKYAYEIDASGADTFDYKFRLIGWVIGGTLTPATTLPSVNLSATFQVNH